MATICKIDLIYTQWCDTSLHLKHDIQKKHLQRIRELHGDGDSGFSANTAVVNSRGWGDRLGITVGIGMNIMVIL